MFSKGHAGFSSGAPATKNPTNHVPESPVHGSNDFLYGGTPCGRATAGSAKPLFHGPGDLEATAGKYMYSCASKEDHDIGAKRPRNVYSSSQVCS